ncbi:MAG: typA [Verrucomicrobiales bacterium]|nr:typA [Verrucomicrobiales bacterium]
MYTRIRNIAIIAHVDHGKTTLVDKLLRAGGAFRENQVVAERSMDSMDLEKEKGITIRAKNTSVHWGDRIINIVDTPGHADFGAEVERVMKMVDGVLLVVDAYDGPQAQTRFVLRKALQEGLKVILVINKIDRPHSEPAAMHDKVLELLLELDATEDQFDAPTFYGSARDGYFKANLSDENVDMMPLLQGIWDHIPAPKVEENGPFRMLASNIAWDDYVGRVAMGKVLSGRVTKGDPVFLYRKDGSKVRAKVSRIFEYSALQTNFADEAVAGNIVGIAGFEDVDIGETLSSSDEDSAIEFVDIDPPTVSMEFAVNDSPGAGKEGKYVTSRQIRDRLMREMKSNISIHVTDSDLSGVFNVSARGAMQIAVLVEQMRREGFELLVSRPNVITKKDESGTTMEPFETLYIEVPEEYVNGVLKRINDRRGLLVNMNVHKTSTLIEAEISTRGLIGFEYDLMNLTSGHGVMSHLFKHYAPWAGSIVTRTTGTLVSMEGGEATPYSLEDIQVRGKLFVAPGDMVYSGMLIGENPRADDLPVNPCKAKQLTNFRAAGNDKSAGLTPPIRFSLERAIEYIQADELVEATPKNIRLRKRILDPNERRRIQKREDALSGV